jgi:arabinose-5-phosphate isomerase
MNYLQKAQRVIGIEIEELQRLNDRLDKKFEQAVTLMFDAVETGRKIIVLGVGKSGQIGEKIAATLTSTGSPAFPLSPVNALHGDLGIVADGDVVLVFSYSGETAELLNILPALKRFHVKIICLTGDIGSTLARLSDVVLDCSVQKEACPMNLAPTSSTTAMLALGDALAMVLLEVRGFDENDFLKYHPGGRLGQTLLRRVGDIMRGKERMPIVAPDTLVLAVLHSMNEHRAGLAVITDSQGKLAGIFTHGDFVRACEQNPEMFSDPVDRHMTRHPITIRSDKFAFEVLNLLDQHRIDDLIVVNDKSEPVGIVDSQDLTKLKLL